MERSLNGKTALVTGASRGIGRAIAERLAKDGATVALTYKASKSGADEAVATIEQAGGTAFAIHADLVDPAAVPTLFERLDNEFTERNGSKALDILASQQRRQFRLGWLQRRDARQLGHPDRGLHPRALLHRSGRTGSPCRRWTHHQHLFRCRHEARDSRAHLLDGQSGHQQPDPCARVRAGAARNYRERRSAGLHANGRERRLPRESRTCKDGRGRNRAGTLWRAVGNRRRRGVLGFR
jgi:hypothetical protein